MKQMSSRERRNLRFRLSNARCGACNAHKLAMFGTEPMCHQCGVSGTAAWPPWDEFPFGKEERDANLSRLL